VRLVAVNIRSIGSAISSARPPFGIDLPRIGDELQRPRRKDSSRRER
jgi:hypothetical protein